MKNIYVLLMQTNTIPSKVIKEFTKYEYSHVGLALEKDCNLIYSFGRKKVHSFLTGGFKPEYKDGDFFTTFDKTICKIFEVNVTDEQYEKVSKIIKEMEENIDIYKYDYLGIALRVSNIPVTFKNKYVCSYFVASVLEKSGVYKFNKEACLVKPEDFNEVEKFKAIYEGSFKEYSI